MVIWQYRLDLTIEDLQANPFSVHEIIQAGSPILLEQIYPDIHVPSTSLIIPNRLLIHHSIHHPHPHHHNMPILMLKIPQNPLPYDRESFINSTTMDLNSMVLVELPIDPMVEAGLPPYVVMELCFTRVQEHHRLGPLDKKCWWTRHLVYDVGRNY